MDGCRERGSDGTNDPRAPRRAIDAQVAEGERGFIRAEYRQPAPTGHARPHGPSNHSLVSIWPLAHASPTGFDQLKFEGATQMEDLYPTINRKDTEGDASGQ